MELKDFKDNVSSYQYAKCLKKGGKGTWYTFKLEVFTQLFRRCVWVFLFSFFFILVYQLVYIDDLGIT